MKILWLTWKDRKNPLAGGAEVVNEELAKRLVADGHEVVFVVGGFEGAKKEEMKDGYKIIRLGNRWTVYYRAFKYYKKFLQGWADIVIDEVNTIPFFAKFYVQERNILFFHQLCREIWFYEMFFPLNLIGYISEMIYLWLLRDRQVITISDSTKNDLVKFGFKSKNISIISEGIELEPVADLYTIKKYDQPTLLSLGTIRSMKRTDHIIKAFELSKPELPGLQLIVAGQAQGKFGQRIISVIKNSKYSKDIKYLGKITASQRIELLQKSHLLAVTSIREGWGLVVTEANSQGTPAVVYDVPGLCDSVKNGVTGIVCERNNPNALSNNIVELFKNKENYNQFKKTGWLLSKEVNFEKSYVDFRSVICK